MSLARTPSTEVDPDGKSLLESSLEPPISQEVIRFSFIGTVKNLEILLLQYNITLIYIYLTFCSPVQGDLAGNANDQAYLISTLKLN